MSDVPFIGRELEIGTLRACLGDAVRSSGRLLLVGGEPGIGKTCFVEAAVAEAKGLGLAVASGGCDPHAGTPEYWPWRQAHRSLATPEPGAPVLLGPELLGDGACTPNGADAGGARDERRFRLFEGAAGGCQRFSAPGRPMRSVSGRGIDESAAI